MDKQQILLDNIALGAKIAHKYFNKKVDISTIEDAYFLIFLLSVLIQGSVTDKKVQVKILEILKQIENE